MSQKQPSSRRPGTAQRPTSEPNNRSVIYIIVVSLVVFSMLIAGLASLDWGALFPDSSEPSPNVNINQLAIQQTVVAQNPDDVEAKVLLATMLSNSGRVQEAIPVFEEAIRQDPDNSETRRLFAMSLQTNGLHQDAEAQFLKAIELNPNDHTAHYYLARLYMDWQPRRQSEAEAHFSRVIEIAPNSFLAEQSQGVLDTLGMATPAVNASPVASPEATE